MHEVYRQCASIVVFRRRGKGTELLLLKKPRKRDAWQLPQGGIEAGEDRITAALRELKEEAGITARVLGESARVYQYDFPPAYRRFRPDNVRGQRIGFVFAEAEKNARITVDRREIASFVWIIPRDLPRYIKRREYRQLVASLIGEGADLLG